MNKIMPYVSLVIWCFYVLLFIYREIIRSGKKKFDLFHLIRIDSVFFLAVYLAYKIFARDEIFIYLFSFIVITNLVYLLYDLVDNYDIKRINISNYLYYLGGIIIFLCIFLYYIFSGNYINTTLLCLTINILIPFYIWLLSNVKPVKKN